MLIDLLAVALNGGCWLCFWCTIQAARAAWDTYTERKKGRRPA